MTLWQTWKPLADLALGRHTLGQGHGHPVRGALLCHWQGRLQAALGVAEDTMGAQVREQEREEQVGRMAANPHMRAPQVCWGLEERRTVREGNRNLGKAVAALAGCSHKAGCTWEVSLNLEEEAERSRQCAGAVADRIQDGLGMCCELERWAASVGWPVEQEKERGSLGCCSLVEGSQAADFRCLAVGTQGSGIPCQNLLKSKQG